MEMILDVAPAARTALACLSWIVPLYGCLLGGGGGGWLQRNRWNILQLKGLGGHLVLTVRNNDQSKGWLFSSILERCLCLISIDSCTTAYSTRSCWSALIQCKDKLQLCVTVLILHMSFTVEILHLIMLVKVNSLLVVLENRDGEMVHGCGRRHTMCLPAEKSLNCRFLHFHVSFLILFNFLNNSFNWQAQKGWRFHYDNTTRPPSTRQSSLELTGLNFSKWYLEEWSHPTLSSEVICLVWFH